MVDKAETRQSILFVPKISISAPNNSNRLNSLKSCQTLQELFDKTSYETDINHRDLVMLLKFHKFSDNSQSTNQKYIEQYCENNFDDLPLFLLFELSKEFHFKKLESRCKEQMILENFQQMNYKKLDLTKCSYEIFKCLLEEYRNLVLDLEIMGLQPKDLTNVVQDYCKVNSISKEITDKLMDDYVNFPLYEVGASKTEMRNSMIQTRNRRSSDTINGSLLNPLKSARKIESSEFGDSSEDSRSRYQPQSFEIVNSLQQSLQTLQSQKINLKTQITSVIQKCKSSNQDNQIDNMIKKIDHKLERIQRKMMKDTLKLEDIQNLALKVSKMNHNSKLQKQNKSCKAPPIMQIDFF